MMMKELMMVAAVAAQVWIVCSARAEDSRAFPETDWAVINRESAEMAAREWACPGKDGKPFWNGHARQYIHPPAFELKNVPGAAKYRYMLKDDAGKVLGTFEAESPRAALTPVWGQVPPGTMVNLEVEAKGEVQKRRFYRMAWFEGPYPAKSHDYRGAAMRCFEYVYNLPHIQAWLKDGTVDEKVYRKYVYPSKILSLFIRALLFYRENSADAEVKARALAIAEKMGQWLIDNSCPAGSPLEHLPPTYWEHAEYHLAKPHIGEIMIIYPPSVGNAYLRLYAVTKDAKWREAAARIAAKMKSMQLESGGWLLVYSMKDGQPKVENLMLLNSAGWDFFTAMAELTGDGSYLRVRDRALDCVTRLNYNDWDWEGQFEDIIPDRKYVNLTKDTAIAYAEWLFERGKIDAAEEIVGWCEDQFVTWSKVNPERCPDNPKMKYDDIPTPTAYEQYKCYEAIDSSMSIMVHAFGEAYKHTGKRLWLEKARALADAVVNSQRADGSIPTWQQPSIDAVLPDWVNCMIYSATMLLELAER